MKYIFSIILFLFIGHSYAQGFGLSGKILDNKDQSPIAGAVVKLVAQEDSSKFRGAITDSEGSFLFEKIRPGKYNLEITYLGYATIAQPLELKNEDKFLGVFRLEQSVRNMKDVEIVEQQIRIQQKGDTTEFNAGAYKTNPDATAEDLVRKMPGITSENGTLKSNGEDVKKVTVDGKNFFGDDVQLALKSLPSDAVDRVQVFDAMSDQGAFSSFDDGNSQKQLNIVTKKGRSNGLFGKVYGGYGYITDSRYSAGANVNWFKGNRRISLLAMSNNVNEQNFSIQDLVSATGGQMPTGGGPRGVNRMLQNSAAGNFFVGNTGGISNTHSVGLNYSDVLGKKVRFSGSYFFNMADNTTDKSLNRQYFNAGDSSTFYSEKNLTTSSNMNHRVNLKMEYYIDSMNSFIVTPKFSIQDNRQRNILTGENTVAGNNFLSATNSNYYAKNIGYNITTDVFYSHKFRKQWRTLSANFNTNVNNKDGNSEQKSLNTFAEEADSLTLNQTYKTIGRNYTLSGNVSYTEPVGENGILLLTYTPSYTRNFNDKETYNVNSQPANSTVLDTTLSNRFNNDYSTQKIGTNFKWRQNNWVATIGANIQYALLTGNQIYPTSFSVKKRFIDMLPTVSFQYKFSETSSLRLNYRTNTDAPSIQQLQTVVDNSNPLLLSTGNADLKQSFSHRIFLRYNHNNMKNQRNFFLFSFINIQSNYITNSTVIAKNDSIVNGVRLRAGSQLSSPTNVNGFVSSRLAMNYSLPLSKIKCNLSLSLGGGYIRTPSFINQKRNVSNNISPNIGASLTSNISEKIDFTLSYDGNYTIVKNTLQTSSDNNYYNHNVGVKFNWMFWKGFVFNTGLTNTLYSGLGSSFNQNIFLWNAALGYKFLKDKSLDVRFSVNDIMNQNSGVSRNVYESYLEDSKTVVLRRYCLLTVTYNLKFFNKP